MAGYLHYCTLLQVWLVILVTGLSMGTINISRPACRADSIQLFNISQVDCVNTTWSLYKKNILIIVWDMHASVPSATFINGYKDKLFLDKSRNIWILDIQDFDEAIYSIRCQIGNITKKYEVKLEVLVEPETRCKPKIIRGVDTLTTYVEPDGCGKPAASAFWLEQPGISVEGNVIKLQTGQEAGTVYACINSPSLRCAKNSKLSDYCSVFKDESMTQTKLSDISGVTIANLVITTLLDGFFILMAIVFYRRIMCMLKKNSQWKHLSVMQNESKIAECSFCKTERIASYIAGTQPFDDDLKLERVDERHKQSTESITSVSRQIIHEHGETLALLEKIETASSTPPHEPEENVYHLRKKVTENATHTQVHEELISQLEDKKTEPPQLSDTEHETEEADTKYQPGTNAETMQELQELRHAALCKVCFEKTMSMVFMPCKHIATCANCSIALQQCPVCRSLIKKKMNIRF